MRYDSCHSQEAWLVFSPMKHTGTCVVCGALYTQNRPLRGSTCSRKCRGHLRRKEKEIRHCKQCGKTFLALPSSKVLFCSIGCFNRSPYRGTNKKAPMLRNCQRCGRQFKRYAGHLAQKFCSLQCVKSPPLEARLCEYCGIEFIPKKVGIRFCTKACGSKSRWQGKDTRVRQTRKTQLLQSSPKCSRCGYFKVSGILQLHHKDRNQDNNSFGNLELLCPNCHEEEHFENKDGRYHREKPQYGYRRPSD